MTLSSDIESDRDMTLSRARKKRFVVLVDRDSYLSDTGQTVKTRTMVCCASFVTTMNLKNCHLKWYSG